MEKHLAIMDRPNMDLAIMGLANMDLAIMDKRLAPDIQIMAPHIQIMAPYTHLLTRDQLVMVV